VKAIVVLTILLLSLTGTAYGATLTVAPTGTPYTSIQDAVDHAVSGDTILIGPGVYSGPVVLSFPLILRGAGVEETTLTQGTLSITAVGVQVEGLTIRGEGNGTGIFTTADTVDLRNIVVEGWESGVLMEGSDGNRISDSEIRDNRGYGVTLQGSTGMILTHTSLRNNGAGGLYIDATSSGNTFYLNNFENAQNVVVEGDGNAWNSPGTISYTYHGLAQQSVMGNYWSDHSGSDINADGIIDSPYIIESKKGKGSLKNPKTGESDLYPLESEWEEFFPALLPTTVITTPITPIPTTLTTPIPTSTPLPTTTASPGGEGVIKLPPKEWMGPVLYLFLFVLVVGLAGGAWFLMRRRDHRSTGTEKPLSSEEIPSTAVSSDTILNRDASRPPEAGMVSPESYFPLELRERYSQIIYAGKGGIARVFRAQRKSDGRIVAVKIPVSFDEATGKTFMKEMRVWEDLHHPNIVEITAANILPLPYVEMEYFDRSLDRCTKPLDPSMAVRIIQGIAEGLSYAHHKGVIHRDLKPQNILLAADLTPKIADWGLSRLLSQDTTASVTGFSLPYASPEQLSPRQFGSTGPWTDIYQMGVILYELLFGILPFGGEGMYETGTAIISTPPSPPENMRPEIARLLPVILRCLEKEPSKRYQSAEEFQEDLKQHLDL
jgi:parallel beta-helix repeat protein